MVEYRSLNPTRETFEDFKALKAEYAPQSSDDEFLRVLLIVYRTQRIAMKAK